MDTCGRIIDYLRISVTDRCNELRLTAGGKVRPCLGDHREIELRAALRHAGGDEAVRDLLRASVLRKPLEHQFHGSYQPCRPMTAIEG